MLLVILTSLAFAQEPQNLPKWEAGFGYFYGDLQDYPGSNESTIRAFPIPYFIYRGEVVRADRRGGLRTRFLKGTFYEFDFSFSGAFPADSEDNKARIGMPDLDWMFEIGPQLKLFLMTSKNTRLQFRIPLRAVFSTDFGSLDHQGYSISPELSWSLLRFPFDFNILNLSAKMSGATTGIHRYFYDVTSEFANSTRAEYSSQKGIMEVDYGLSLVSRWDQWAIYLGFGFNSYKLAKNKESPLHTADRTRSYFAGFIYSFYQSKNQGSR